MKSKSKLLLILLLCFVTTNVKAFKVGDVYTWGPKDSYRNSSRFYGANSNYSVGIYHVAEGNYPIYCLDPGLGTPQSMRVADVLLDDESKLAQDSALIAAVEYDAAESTQVKFQKGIAVRMLYIGKFGRTNTNVYGAYTADFQAAAKAAEKKCGTSISGELYLTDGSNGLIIDSSNSAGVMYYFCKGIDAYNNAQKGISTYPSISKGTEEKVETDTGADYIIEINAKNFGTGSGKSFMFTGTTGITVYGYSFIYVKDATSTEYSKNDFNSILNKDLVSDSNFNDFFNGKKSLYVAVHLAYDPTTSSDDSTCANGLIEYTYTHPDAVNGAILRSDAGGGDNSQLQKFIIFADKNDSSITVGSDTCGGPCPTSSNLIPSICEDGVESSKTTTGSTSVIGKSDGNGNVVYSFREVYFNGNDNVRTCVVGNTDEALNSYKYVNTSTASSISSNKYCALYCKEDYVFNMPYKKNTENGRYFNISMDVAGKQSCYSTNFNSSLLYSDMCNLEEEAIAAYNDYVFYNYIILNWSSIKKGNTNYPVENVNKKTGNCYTDSYEDCTTTTGSDGKSVQTCVTKYYCDDTYKLESANEGDTYYTLSLAPIYSSFILNTACEKSTGELVSDSRSTYTNSYKTDDFYYDESNHIAVFGQIVESETSTSNRHCSSKSAGCTDIETIENKYKFESMDDVYNNNYNTFVTKRAEAITKLQSAINNFNKIINQYNSCTGVEGIKTHDFENSSFNALSSVKWYTTYKYEPVYYYSFGEPYGDDYSTNKWISAANVIGADKMVYSSIDKYSGCDSDEGSETNVVFATGPLANGTYSCTNSDKIKDLDYDNGGLTDDATLDTRMWCTAQTNNKYECESEENKITNPSEVSNSKYIKNINALDFSISGTKVTYNGRRPYNITKVVNTMTNATVTGSYDTPRVYYTSSPTGEVTVSIDTPTDTSKNWSRVEGLPVAIKTPIGLYYYKILITDLGTYYNTQTLGRIYDNDSSSISSLNSPVTLEDADETDAADTKDELESNAYACSYQVGNTCTDSKGVTHTKTECNKDESWDECVERICLTTGTEYCVETASSYCNCPGQSYSEECTCYEHTPEGRKTALDKISCNTDTGENCDHNYNCCPYCTIACVGTCIFESKDDEDYNGETMLDFRAVNPSELNPNTRNLGYNWNSGEKDVSGNYNWSSGAVTNVLVAQKAGITIDEIESRATVDEIDLSNTSSLSSLSEYALSVTMTPTMITEIKKYNKDAESSGNYNNQTLKCYDYVLSDDYNYDKCKSGGFTWVPDDNTKPTGSGKCKMENIMCYSTFITKLKTDFGDLVDAPSRPNDGSDIYESSSGNITNYGSASGSGTQTFHLSNSAQFNQNLNDTDITDAGYTVEVKTVNNYWAIFRYNTLDINGDGVPDIGPSWR